MVEIGSGSGDLALNFTDRIWQRATSSGNGAASALMPVGVAKTGDQGKSRLRQTKVDNRGNPAVEACLVLCSHGK